MAMASRYAATVVGAFRRQSTAVTASFRLRPSERVLAVPTRGSSLNCSEFWIQNQPAWAVKEGRPAHSDGRFRQFDLCLSWTARLLRVSSLPFRRRQQWPNFPLMSRGFHVQRSANGCPPCPRVDHRRSKGGRLVRELPLPDLAWVSPCY